MAEFENENYLKHLQKKDLEGLLPLNIRSWSRPDRGRSHDRDVAGARNIKTVGLAGLA